MEQDRDKLEAILCEAYGEQAQLYTRALEIVSGLRPKFEQGQGDECQEPIRELQGILDKVASIESHIAEAKRLWNDSSARPSTSLQAALDRVSDLLSRMIKQIGVTEQAALARLKKLAPQLDAEVRSMKMRDAYGEVRKNRAP